MRNAVSGSESEHHSMLATTPFSMSAILLAKNITSNLLLFLRLQSSVTSSVLTSSLLEEEEMVRKIMMVLVEAVVVIQPQRKHITLTRMSHIQSLSVLPAVHPRHLALLQMPERMHLKITEEMAALVEEVALVKAGAMEATVDRMDLVTMPVSAKEPPPENLQKMMESYILVVGAVAPVALHNQQLVELEVEVMEVQQMVLPGKRIPAEEAVEVGQVEAKAALGL